LLLITSTSEDILSDVLVRLDKEYYIVEVKIENENVKPHLGRKVEPIDFCTSNFEGWRVRNVKYVGYYEIHKLHGEHYAGCDYQDEFFILYA